MWRTVVPKANLRIKRRNTTTAIALDLVSPLDSVLLRSVCMFYSAHVQTSKHGKAGAVIRKHSIRCAVVFIVHRRWKLTLVEMIKSPFSIIPLTMAIQRNHLCKRLQAHRPTELQFSLQSMVNQFNKRQSNNKRFRPFKLLYMQLFNSRHRPQPTSPQPIIVFDFNINTTHKRRVSLSI